MSWGRSGRSGRCTGNGEEQKCLWRTWETSFSYLKRFEHEMWAVERLWMTCSSLTVHRVSPFFNEAGVWYFTSWADVKMNADVSTLVCFTDRPVANKWILQETLTSLSSDAQGKQQWLQFLSLHLFPTGFFCPAFMHKLDQHMALSVVLSLAWLKAVPPFNWMRIDLLILTSHQGATWKSK